MEEDKEKKKKHIDWVGRFIAESLNEVYEQHSFDWEDLPSSKVMEARVFRPTVDHMLLTFFKFPLSDDTTELSRQIVRSAKQQDEAIRRRRRKRRQKTERKRPPSIMPSIADKSGDGLLPGPVDQHPAASSMTDNSGEGSLPGPVDQHPAACQQPGPVNQHPAASEAPPTHQKPAAANGSGPKGVCQQPGPVNQHPAASEAPPTHQKPAAANGSGPKGACQQARPAAQQPTAASTHQQSAVAKGEGQQPGPAVEHPAAPNMNAKAAGHQKSASAAQFAGTVPMEHCQALAIIANACGTGAHVWIAHPDNMVREFTCVNVASNDLRVTLKEVTTQWDLVLEFNQVNVHVEI